MKKKIKRKKITKAKKKKIIRRIQIGLVLVVILAFWCGIIAYRDYRERPGVMERDSLKAIERGKNYITLQWDEVRNTDTYTLYYREKDAKAAEWTEITIDSMVEGDAAEDVLEKDGEARVMTATLKKLKEGTVYSVVIRADNEEREGFETKEKNFATKKTQTIKARSDVTKLISSKSFTLAASAETNLSYESSNKNVASIDAKTGKVKIKKPGTTTIKITADENQFYVGTAKKVKLTVLDSRDVSAGGAAAMEIYHLSSDNCTIVQRVTGDGSIHVPQGLGYTGDKYIIAYGMDNAQRVITFDIASGDKSIAVPSVSMGHPNGFAYCSTTGLCYSVQGWSSRCVTYSPETGKFSVINLPHGCSGIGYDQFDNVFYTASRTAMRSYSADGSFKTLMSVGVVSHSGKMYTQDCGGGAGILVRVLSGSSKHGTNYIDLYNMRNGTYIGTLTTNLGEVESAIVDNDGYIELLCNNMGKVDYIWKTPINVLDISDGFEK